MFRHITYSFLLVATLGLLGSSNTASKKNLPDGYKGKPFRDEFHKTGAHVIPGRVQCALFDLGGGRHWLS